MSLLQLVSRSFLSWWGLEFLLWSSRPHIFQWFGLGPPGGWFGLDAIWFRYFVVLIHLFNFHFHSTIFAGGPGYGAGPQVTAEDLRRIFLDRPPQLVPGVSPEQLYQLLAALQPPPLVPHLDVPVAAVAVAPCPVDPPGGVGPGSTCDVVGTPSCMAIAPNVSSGGFPAER